MKTITLRNIPAVVQKAIRAKAYQKRISVNEAVIELLAEHVGALEDRRKTIHHDLDDLAGSWSTSEARAFEKALQPDRQIDEGLVKARPQPPS